MKRHSGGKQNICLNSLTKVTEGVSGQGGFPDTPPTFCFSAKERQLVQVVVSPYMYPTFVLSMAVVLLVVKVAEKQKVGGVSGNPLHRLFTGSLFQAMDTFFWSVFPLLLGTSTGNLS